MLRTRLFLGFLPLLAILMAVGLYATWLVSHVVGETEGVFLRSYRNSVAGQEMKEAVWRMDRGIRFTLDGHAETGKLLFDANAASFERAFAIQHEGAPGTEDRRLLKEMEASFNAYRDAGRHIFSLTNHTQQQIEYGGQFPRQTNLLAIASEIQQANEGAMTRAKEKMFSARNQSAWFMLGA